MSSVLPAEDVAARGVELAIPGGWTRVAEPADPDLVCELTQADAEIQVYLEDSAGRSLEGLWVALRYAVVIDWGGTLLKDAAARLAGLPARSLEFQARPPEGGVRRYVRMLCVKDDQKLTVQASAPPASFAAARAGLQAVLGSLRWREPSAPERV